MRFLGISRQCLIVTKRYKLTLVGLSCLLATIQSTAEPITIEGEYRQPSAAYPTPPSVSQVLNYDDRLNHDVRFGELTSDEKEQISNLNKSNSGVFQIGIHRESNLLRGLDLLEDLTWRMVDRKWVGTVTVSSQDAKSVRLYLHLATSQPIELVFFGFDKNGQSIVVDSVEVQPLTLPKSEDSRELLPNETLDLWSPSVEGSVIGIEIRFSDKESIDRAHLSIIKLAHRVLSDASHPQPFKV